MIKEIAMGLVLLASTVTAKAETIPMSVEILPDFGLGVDSEKFKFLPISGGNATGASVGLNVASNKDTSWSLQVSAPDFTRENDTTVLPRESVTYRVLGGLGQRFPEMDHSDMLPAEDKTIYVAAPSEYTSGGTMITLTVNIFPPKSQKAGKYNSTLKVTLVDNF